MDKQPVISAKHLKKSFGKGESVQTIRIRLPLSADFLSWVTITMLLPLVTSPETSVYASETIYDIDCEKHFDISIGSTAAIILSSGKDEKLHVKLSSATLETLSSSFKK